jgi:hypothetical protein
MAEMTTVCESPRLRETGSHAPRLRRAAPSIAFVAVELLALIFFLVRGRGLWFFNDEWDFLANRTAGDIGDVLGAHNAHPSVLPVLLYRLLWQFFGLDTYTPYQLVVIALHLGTAALLRVVMVRSMVQPWLATVAASAFALFGYGYENIVWGFQVGYSGSLFFGVAAVLLADHDGGAVRRDLLAFASALAALACSNVGLAMVAAMTVAVIVRRGWRPAALLTAPLVAIYVAWWAAWGHDTYRSTRSDVPTALVFAARMIRATITAVTQSNVLAIALVVIVGVGIALMVAQGSTPGARAQWAGSLGLLVGACIFAIATGVERAVHVSAYAASRYVDVALALLLPALAVAVGRFARLGTPAYVVALAVLVAGITGNVMKLDDYLAPRKAEESQFRRDVLAIPTLRDQITIDPDTPVLSLHNDYLTFGWLLHSDAKGKIPAPPDDSPVTNAFAELRVSLATILWPLPPDYGCEIVRRPTHLTLGKGEFLNIRGRAELRPDIEPVPRRFLDVPTTMLIATREPVRLRISAHSPNVPPKVCAADHAWRDSA